MPKVILFSLFFLLFFLTPKDAFAACTHTVNPPVITDPDHRGNMTITTSAECREFLGVEHRVIFYPLSAHDNIGKYAVDGTVNTKITPTDEHNITAPIDLYNGSKGKQSLGTWYAKVCNGSSTECGGDPSINPKVVALASFQVQQSGGGDVQIEPVAKELEAGETPQVLLINATPGNVYLLFWNDDKFSVQEATVPENSNTPINLKPGDNSNRFNEVGEKTLCATIKNDRSINIGRVGLPCDHPAHFVHRGTKILREKSCRIEPKAPSTEDNVTFVGINFPLNTDFRAELTANGETKEIGRPNSGAPGDITATVGKKGELSKDIVYEVKLYDLNGTEQCKSSFSIKDPIRSGPGSAAQTCRNTPFGEKPKPGDCSAARGQVCGKDNAGIATAIGCIHTKPEALIQDLFRFAIGIGGGIAFLMMIVGAFEMITSAGNADALKNGQGRFTNAIIGLLFIVFSVLLLQIIGVDILGLEGFGKPT